ncbi:MAG: hypothetical protein SVV80_11350 [Planctomycetota bacterium]|nr:hypothetical protein [Planctomycetota bacterium]
MLKTAVEGLADVAGTLIENTGKVVRGAVYAASDTGEDICTVTKSDVRGYN